MYEMAMRIFALIGIFVTVVIPWLLGVAAIFVMVCRKMDKEIKEDTDDFCRE